MHHTERASIFRGGDVAFAAKELHHLLFVAISAGERDLAHGKVCLEQHFPDVLDAALVDITGDREARLGFEDPCQIVVIIGKGFRDVAGGDLSGVHPYPLANVLYESFAVFRAVVITGKTL